MQQLTLEEEEARSCAAALESEVAALEREASTLEASAAEVEALETRHWSEFNDYQLELRHHMGERDALLTKIDRAGQRLQLLKVRKQCVV
jgi:beclin 1